MRVIALVLPILFCAITGLTGDIREFDVKTLQRLGNELTRVSQTRDRGVTTPERKLARETAMAALRGNVANIHYDYVVLDDPAGSGFLVYALGSTGKSGQFVLAGHIRVSVSADGRTVKRIDPLSRTLLIEADKNTGLPKDTHLAGMWYHQIVSNKPVETLIYTSNLSKKPIMVGTPDGKMWKVANGTMSIDRSRPGTDTMGGVARKALQQYGR